MKTLEMLLVTNQQTDFNQSVIGKSLQQKT